MNFNHLPHIAPIVRNESILDKDIWKDIKGIKEPYLYRISGTDRNDYKHLTSFGAITRLNNRSDRRIKKFLNSLGSIPRTLVIEELW